VCAATDLGVRVIEPVIEPVHVFSEIFRHLKIGSDLIFLHPETVRHSLTMECGQSGKPSFQPLSPLLLGRLTRI